MQTKLFDAHHQFCVQSVAHLSSPVAAGTLCLPRWYCVHEEVRCAPAAAKCHGRTTAVLSCEACPSPPSPSDDCAVWWLRCLKTHVQMCKLTQTWKNKTFRREWFLSFTHSHPQITATANNTIVPSNTLATSVLYDSNLKGVRKPKEPRWNAITGGTLPYRKKNPT